jgi:hypothetical protein
MYMPMWDPNAESLVTGPSQDDHDGGPAAGVASGFDPSGGEPAYQFGNQWVRVAVVCARRVQASAPALGPTSGDRSAARLRTSESIAPANSVCHRECDRSNAAGD